MADQAELTVFTPGGWRGKLQNVNRQKKGRTMFDKLSKAQVTAFYAAHGILPRRKGQRFDISFANHYGIWLHHNSVVAAIPTLLLSPCGNAENAEYLVCSINGRLVPAYRFIGKMACQLRSYKAA